MSEGEGEERRREGSVEGEKQRQSFAEARREEKGEGEKERATDARLTTTYLAYFVSAWPIELPCRGRWNERLDQTQLSKHIPCHRPEIAL